MIKLKNIIILTFTTVLLLLTNVEAQQLPVYTQYVFNEYVMNPAVAGTVDHSPIRMSYRDQWSGFTDIKGNNVAPKTFSFSAHTPISNSLAIGGFAYNDVTGPISQTTGQISYSWRGCLSPQSCFWEKKKFISFAYGVRFIQWAFDETQTEDYSGTILGINDPVLPNTVETDVLVSHTVASYFYTEYFYAGLSAQNLFTRALKIQTHQSYENRLTPEYNFMAGAYLPFTEDRSLAVEPSILTKTTSWSETQIDISLRFIYENSVWLGSSYRASEQAFAFLFGVERGDWFIGYSYDTAVKGIDNYSSGTHEIALGINLSMFSNFDNVRLKSRFKNRRMLLNPFRRTGSSNRRGAGV